ncbi:MAG TPA: hypothetical protein V6C76_03040 [Drouetiella sp.]
MAADDATAKQTKSGKQTTPEASAADTSTETHNALHEHGPEAAYEVLKKDYDSFVREHGGDAEQKQAYWDSATQKLNDILPDLSIAWGENRLKSGNLTSLDRTALQTVAQDKSNALDSTLAAKLAPAVKELKTENDGRIVTRFEDGTSQSLNPANFSVVATDSANRVTAIHYADGKQTKFAYNEQGEVAKVTSPNGAVATLRDGQWLGPSGNDTGISNVRVRPDGNYSYSHNGLDYTVTSDRKSQSFDSGSIDKAAAELHNAKDNTFMLFSSPDQNKLWNILEPMSAAQRQLVRESYEKQFPGHSLEQDLKDKLGSTDFAKAQSLLRREDGVADNSGQVWQALTKLPGATGDDKLRAESEIRDALNTLTAEQVKAVSDKFQRDFGKNLNDTLQNNSDLSDESKAALNVYLKGTDKVHDQDRLQLADAAMKAGRPDIFNEVFRDASQAARDKFIADGGMKKIDDAFWFGDKQIAKDYVERGTVSLSTIADGDTHWYHTNQDDIDRAVSKATDIDRQDFKRGEELSRTGAEAKTPEDARALKFYQSVDAQMHSSGNDRQAALWEAKLRNNEEVITNILQSHQEGSWFFGMGAGTDKNKQLAAVENMTEKDWKFLKANPEEVSKIDAALNTFSDSNHDQVMNALKAKLEKDSFSDAQSVGNRPVDQRLQDSSNDQAARLDALTKMSDAERKAYVANTDGYRDKINATLSTDAEKFLANRIAESNTGVGAVERVLIDGIKKDNPAATFADIESALKSDRTLQDRLAHPVTDEDKQLSSYFHSAVNNAVDVAGLGDSVDEGGNFVKGKNADYAKAAFETGHVPLDMQTKLTKDNAIRNEMILHCTADERAKLIEKNPDAATRQFQNDVFGDDKDVRKVLENGLQQRDPENGRTGYLDQADKFRLFAAQGGDSEALKATLEKMTPEDRQNLANQFYTKYGKLVTDDVISKVPSDQQWRFRELLSPTDVNVRQVALDAQLSNDSHTSSFDGFMSGFWDYSRVSADSSQSNLNKFVKDHAAELDKLPPEQRQQFNDAVNNYMAAEKSYVDSKGKMAEALVDATITLAAVGGAAFSGGASLALLSEIGAAGAVYRIGAMRAMQGTDFDSSAKNIFKQGFEGGASAFIGALGPEALGLKGLAIGSATATSLADRLVTGVGTKALFKEGSEEAIAQTFATLTRQGAIAGDKQIAALAEKVAADGVDKGLVENALKEQVKKEVMTGLRNVVINESEAFARNLAAAQLGGQGKELAATAVGLESPETLFERMKGTAVGTAAGVTFFHSLFRIGAGNEYVKIALGKGPDGNYIAGGETPVRHADGRIEVVPPGKTLVLGSGDTIPKTMSATKTTWGTMMKDANGEIQHMDTPAGGFTRVPGKPNTFLDDFGREVELTNIKENADGSLSYHSHRLRTRYDGTPEMDKHGFQKVEKSDVVFAVAKTQEAQAAVSQIREAKSVADLKQAIESANQYSTDPAVRAAVRMAVIKELEDTSNNFHEVKALIDAKYAGSKFDDVRPEDVRNPDGTMSSIPPDERLSAALRERAVYEVEKDPSRVFTDVNPAMRAAMDEYKKGNFDKSIKKNITNAINPDLSPEEKAAALYLMGQENMPLLDQLISKLNTDYPELQFSSGVKKFETSLSKVLRDGKDVGVENLGDSVRLKSVMPNFDHLPAIVQDLKDAGFKIINSDNADPSSVNNWQKGTGWRAINFQLLMPNGQIAEYQMSIKEFEAIEGNHENYEFIRKFAMKGATPQQILNYKQHLSEVQAKFEEAWQLHLRNTGKTEEQVHAIINEMHRTLHMEDATNV